MPRIFRFSPLIFFTIFYTLTVFCLHAQTAEEMNRRISNNIVQEIILNPVSSAREPGVVQTALEYNPQNSDALYLMAEIEISRSNLPRATALLAEALSWENWRHVYRSEAVILHASTLAERRQFQALETLYGEREQWISWLDEPEMLLLVAEGLYRNGGEFRTVLERAAERHPGDIRFPALRIFYEETPLISDYSWLVKTHYQLVEERAAMMDKMMEADISMDKMMMGDMMADSMMMDGAGEMAAELAVFLPAMLHYLLTMEVGSSRTELLELYTSWAEADDLAHYLAFAELSFAERADYFAEPLADNVPNDYLLALAIRGEDSSTAGRRFFEDFLQNRELDINQDRKGGADATLSYGGGLETVRVNRDGLVQEIFFQADVRGRIVPDSLLLRGERGTLQLFYDEYPRVRRALFLREESDFLEETSYSLKDMSFVYPLVDFAPRGLGLLRSELGWLAICCRSFCGDGVALRRC